MPPVRPDAEAPDRAQGGAEIGPRVFIVVALVIALVVAVVTRNAGWVVAIVVILAVVLYRLIFSGGQEAVGKDSQGRLVLQPGSERPIPETERSRLLDEEVGEYMRDGFFVRQRTPTAAQLVRPKRFSFLWAFLWFLVFGVGIVVYLIYYAAKQDEGRYVEVDEYGTVRSTRQIHHVL